MNQHYTKIASLKMNASTHIAFKNDFDYYYSLAEGKRKNTLTFQQECAFSNSIMDNVGLQDKSLEIEANNIIDYLKRKYSI